MTKLLINEDYVKFYNPNRVWSRQDCNFFLITGGRGTGKTTGFLCKALHNALDHEKQFVYVRRYKAETKKLKGLLSDLLPNVHTRAMGDGGFYAYIYDGKVLGYCIPLTQQQSLKSNKFPEVTTIIYDEAILKRGGTYRYLDDEVVQFLELVSTIVRLRDDYKVFVLGNNADICNPYNEYFRIPKFEKIYIDKARHLYAENVPIKAELRAVEETTALYALTKGTPYGEYHYNNAVLVSNNYDIAPKPKNCELWKRIAYNSITLVFWIYEKSKGTYAIWCEGKEGLIGENTYKYLINDNPNYSFIKQFRASNHYALMRDIYWREDMSFDTDQTAEIVAEIMNDLK